MIDEIVSKIVSREREYANAIEKIKDKIELKTFKSKKFSGHVVAIDGGLLKKSLHGIDIVLTRAVGVCFEYEKGSIKKVEYFPEKFTKPKIEVLESPSEFELSSEASLLRTREEMSLALKCAERFSPDFLLLDGALKPSIGIKSEELENLYAELFNKEIPLIGVVKDSRATSLCLNILKKEMRDTVLLDSVLGYGQSTNPMFYSFVKKIAYFYIKTAKLDRPIRVEFINTDHAKVSELLLSLCSHKNYGIPVPLIEADNVARLSERDMEFLCRKISKTAKAISKELRRSDRAF